MRLRYYKCSFCKKAGHNRRTCDGWLDSLNIARWMVMLEVGKREHKKDPYGRKLRKSLGLK